MQQNRPDLGRSLLDESDARFTGTVLNGLIPAQLKNGLVLGRESAGVHVYVKRSDAAISYFGAARRVKII